MSRIVQIDEPSEANFSPYAQLRTTRDALEAFGIHFTVPVPDGTWTEAGPIAVAFVRVDEGPALMLVSHTAGPPDIGIDVRASTGLVGTGAAEDLAQALGLNESLGWIREDVSEPK
jgi:hypothetical protein